MSLTLEQYFPILEVSGGCIVAKSGDYTVGFELTKPEIFTLGSEELNSVHQAWVRALALLAPNTIVHLQDWFTQATYQLDADKAGRSWLSQASEDFFHGRPYLEHRSYLFITRQPAAKKMRPATSALLQRQLVLAELLDEEMIRDFLEQAGRFERMLTASGLLQCRKLTDEDLTGDGNKIGIIEQYCQLSGFESAINGARVRPVRDISFQDGIRIGEYEVVIYTLADAAHLPSHCSNHTRYAPYSTEKTGFTIGFATSLGTLLPYNHICSQFIRIEDPGLTTNKFEQKRRRTNSLSQHSRENAITRQAIDEHLNEAITQHRQMVKMHCNLFAWTTDRTQMHVIRKDISAAIAQLGAHPHPETICGPVVWYGGIPGNAGDLPLDQYVDTFGEQAACFIQSETNYRSSDSPFGIRLGDRITGRPVHTDISDEPMRKGWITNRNKAVLGGSGSGKSFVMNLISRSYYEQGAHMLIIDMGNSYEGLCQLVKGHYFRYHEQAPLAFNPFLLPKNQTLDIEKRESLKAVLLALWKKEDEAFLRSEYVALSNAIQQYYDMLDKHTDISPCFNSFYDFLQNEFAPGLAGERVKTKDFDIDNFLYVLRPYYGYGEYAYLLNSADNVNLIPERFIVFELDVIRDHPILLAVTTILIAELFVAKMRKLPGARKVIVIEEAWKALARQGMSEYIRYLFKTVRKYSGEAIVVSQELDDIISSPIIKQAILNNADCKILLDQSKFQNRFDAIQEILGLTEKEKAMVLSVNRSNEPGRRYKEVFISLNGHSKVYRVEVSLEEYLTYTTEESEKVLVQKYAEKYGDLSKGIAVLAAEWKEKK
jgi:conjugation system TraG family ATPase